jgi:predicted amino acid dehydrogenase
VNQHSPRYVRVRQTAIGALAALAAVGAIAGAAALASEPHARPHRHHAAAYGSKAQSASDQVQGKSQPSQPGTVKPRGSRPDPNPQPFLDAVTQLVDNNTITAAQGQIVDNQIQTGRIDTDALVAAGFTQSQADAVQQALGSVKQSMAPSSPPTGVAKPTDGSTRGSRNSPQPFLAAITQLVANRTITPAQGHVVDSAIQDGTFDPDSLASSGFTESQIHAIEDALASTKRSLANAAPAGTGPSGTTGPSASK